MTTELIRMIDRAVALHTKAIINYEKMRLVANKNTSTMDYRQKIAHKKEMMEIMKMIRELK